ncbi:MAG TPA: signal peptide peptidase SppA, partial [Bacteroidetes bacterium]|nr:signal peptide peptidase SppA [Bacteroidota bacterium]
LNDFLKAIDHAKKDKNIKGVLMDMNNVKGSWASLEEVRNKLIELKSEGKFIIAYADMYFNSSYYLASVANEVYLTNNGELVFNGLSRKLTFFKNALDKLGVEVQTFKVGKFKSAVEPFLLDKMSEANREQNLSFLNSFYDKMLKGISEERELDIYLLDSLADNLIIRNAEDAFQYKMVDSLLYKDQIIEIIKDKLGLDSNEDINTVDINTYNKSIKENVPDIDNKKIAVVFASGDIVDGKGDKESIGGARLSKTIRKLRKNKDIKAMVLRVNSPGGSALASEIIWREIQKTKEIMPVIVSMGNLAASGGYYISCLADTIVAQPNTITGSIGVFGLIPNMQELFEGKLGFSFDLVKTGKYGDLGSMTRKVTDSESSIIQKSVNDIYDLFLTRVSEGRKMDKDMVHEIAQGRVWTGIQAKEIGLVDVIGGLEKAIEIAAAKIDLEEYSITEYPQRKEKPWTFVLDALENKTATKSILKENMGKYYYQYKSISDMSRTNTIQARVPYFIEVY